MKNNPSAKYLCTACDTSFLDRPSEGICPNCPDEPIFDMGTQEGQHAVRQIREDNELTRRAKIGNIGLWVGGIVGVIVIAVLTITSSSSRAYYSPNSFGAYGAVWIFCVGAGRYIEYKIRKEPMPDNIFPDFKN